jgi:hypothetical protein
MAITGIPQIAAGFSLILLPFRSPGKEAVRANRTEVKVC